MIHISKNDAVKPKMQSRVCSVLAKNVVKGHHPIVPFQSSGGSNATTGFAPCPTVAMDTWIFPQLFPHRALHCEQAKKIVIFPMWWSCYSFGGAKENCGGNSTTKIMSRQALSLHGGLSWATLAKTRIPRVCVSFLSLLCLERELSAL